MQLCPACACLESSEKVEVLQQIFILYMVAGVGFVLTKAKVFDDNIVRAMSALVAKVGIPAMAICKLQEAGDISMMPALMQTIWLSFVFLLVVLAISYTIFRKQEIVSRAVLTQMSALSNCGFMGYPVIEAALGPVGLMHSIALNMSFTILAWTAGLRLFAGKQKGAWRQMLNPGLIASLVGMLLFACNIRLPELVHSGLNYLQVITTPLSMLVTGAYMSRITKDVALNRKMWLGCGLRLVAYPLFTLGVMALLPIELIQKQMFYITMMMPCASVTVIQALNYSTEDAARLSTGGVALSTILSAATIPLLLTLMPMLG